MPTESEIIIAFLFKRSGEKTMTKSHLYLTLSMDLKWFTPKKAKKFVDHSLEEELLTTNKKNKIKPNFDINKIEIPIRYQPSEDILKGKKESNKEEKHKTIIEEIIRKTGEDREKVLKKIGQIEQEKKINFQVAALLLGKEYGVKLEEFYEEVENKILK